MSRIGRSARRNIAFAHRPAPLLGTCRGICSYGSAVSPRRPLVKSSSRLRDPCSLSSNTSVTQARAAVMTEHTMHSSCSPAHARPLVAMHRAVTARVSVTSRAAAVKVSWSFHAANSLCAGCDEQHLLRVEVVHHVSVVSVDGSGHAYPQLDGIDGHQRTLCL